MCFFYNEVKFFNGEIFILLWKFDLYILRSIVSDLELVCQFGIGVWKVSYCNVFCMIKFFRFYQVVDDGYGSQFKIGLFFQFFNLLLVMQVVVEIILKLLIDWLVFFYFSCVFICYDLDYVEVLLKLFDILYLIVQRGRSIDWCDVLSLSLL